MNSPVPLASLIVAVYNKADNLRLVLAACARQSMREFEIIIADDGSSQDVMDVVEEARTSSPVPIQHLWHEDRGWRKNVMLNNGIRAARSEYLVFIDGDCLPACRFMEDHWTAREQGRVLLGRRVETSARWTGALTADAVASGRFERIGVQELLDGLRGEMLRVEDGYRISSRFVRRMLRRNVRGMLGSNFSAWKKDLEAINGFDEEYDGPGCGEDSDVQYRLGLIGVTGKSLRNLAIQFHLWHPRTPVSDACWERFERMKSSPRPRCRKGLENLET